MKKKIIGGIIAIILGGILFSYSILKSNVGKKIKCPTYPVDYEYEGVIKAEYKSLVLIDGTYGYIDFDKVYDGCYRDAGLEENKLVCPNGYDSGARIEEKGEWVLDT